MSSLVGQNVLPGQFRVFRLDQYSYDEFFVDYHDHQSLVSALKRAGRLNSERRTIAEDVYNVYNCHGQPLIAIETLEAVV